MAKFKVAVQRPTEHREFRTEIWRAELAPSEIFHAPSPWWRVQRLEPTHEAYRDGIPFLHSGFFDSHLHLSYLGDSALDVDLRDCSSTDQLIEKLTRVTGDPRTLVRGQGWEETKLGITWDQLSQSVVTRLPNQVPLLLFRVCGHSALLNPAFCRWLGIGMRSGALVKDPSADADAVPGIVTDRDLHQIMEWLPPRPRQEIEDSWIRAHDILVNLGVRAVGDMSIDQVHLEVIQDVFRRSRSSIDVDLVLEGGKAPAWESPMVSQNKSSAAKNIRANDLMETPDLSPVLGQTARLSALYWKRYLDGSFGSKTAWLSRAYEGSEYVGDSLVADDVLMVQVEQQLRAGRLLSFHVIGDGALDQALRVSARFGSLMRAVSTQHGRPHRLEHVQLVRDDQIQTLKQHGVWACCLQPHHRVSDAGFIESRIGRDRYLQQAYPFMRLLRAGVAVALGSDAPIDREDPRACIRAILDDPRPLERSEQRSRIELAMWYHTTGGQLALGRHPGFLRVGELACLTEPFV